MNAPEQTGLRWIKAAKSYGNGACVEMASVQDGVLMRDSKNPGVQLAYSLVEMDAFLDGAKRGEFDHLVYRD